MHLHCFRREMKYRIFSKILLHNRCIEFSTVTKGQGHLQLHAAVKYVQNYIKCMHTGKMKPLLCLTMMQFFPNQKQFSGNKLQGF